MRGQRIWHIIQWQPGGSVHSAILHLIMRLTSIITTWNDNAVVCDRHLEVQKLLECVSFCSQLSWGVQGYSSNASIFLKRIKQPHCRKEENGRQPRIPVPLLFGPALPSYHGIPCGRIHDGLLYKCQISRRAIVKSLQRQCEVCNNTCNSLQV